MTCECGIAAACDGIVAGTKAGGQTSCMAGIPVVHVNWPTTVRPMPETLLDRDDDEPAAAMGGE